MTTIADNDIVRVDFTGDWNTTVALAQAYQFQLQSGGPLTVSEAITDMVDLLEDIWTIIDSLYQAITAFRKIRARIVPGGTILGDYVWATALTGTESTDVSSTTVTAPISFLTSTPHVVLRKSFGPLPENRITASGELGASVATDLAAVATYLLQDQAATNGTWRYGYYSPKTTSFVVPTVASYSVAPGTMARRRLGRGT